MYVIRMILVVMIITATALTVKLFVIDKMYKGKFKTF